MRISNAAVLSIVIFLGACSSEKKSTPLSEDVKVCSENPLAKAGKSFPSVDGCNICICDENGHTACTDMACAIPDPVVNSCDDAEKKYNSYVVEISQAKLKSCKVDSDCVLKELAVRRCNLPQAWAKSTFSRRVNNDLEALSANMANACKNQEPEPYGCAGVAPYNAAVCTNNVCVGTYGSNDELQ